MRAKIRFKVMGLSRTNAMLNALRGFIRSGRMMKLLASTANTMRAGAHKDVPKKSYLLRRSIYAVVQDFLTDNPKIVLGTEGSKYARWVEEGGVPHPIVPRNKKWLRWTTKGYRGPKVPTPPGVIGPPGLVEIFKKRVKHPGNKPQPFIRPQLEKIRLPLLIAIQKAISIHLNEAGKKQKEEDTQ